MIFLIAVFTISTFTPRRTEQENMRKKEKKKEGIDVKLLTKKKVAHCSILFFFYK